PATPAPRPAPRADAAIPPGRGRLRPRLLGPRLLGPWLLGARPGVRDGWRPRRPGRPRIPGSWPPGGRRRPAPRAGRRGATVALVVVVLLVALGGAAAAAIALANRGGTGPDTASTSGPATGGSRDAG